MNLLSQKFPSYRGGHSQVATPFISLHKPPFLQGLGEHTLASISNENKQWQIEISSFLIILVFFCHGIFYPINKPSIF